jgi:hypothetical protein
VAAGIIALGSMLTWSNAQPAFAQEGKRLEIYGFAMTDVGFQFKQNDPNWFDVVRPTRLPAFDEEFGEDGRTYFSVRQTRFGVKGFLPTKLGELRTTFEWELFGVGVDQGQTTLRLRHAYGELGNFGAGQYWSPFMDIDVFPNSIEYWGPNGMVFFRNVQVRWMPVRGQSRVTLALERPGASGDGGVYADRVELENVLPRFSVPDFSGEFRYGRDWGYVELSGILRQLQWDDVLEDQFDISGNELGWGVHLSSNVKGGDGTLRLSAVYGAGIQNYMNDAPVDVGLKDNPGSSITPVVGEALPILGLVGFYDHKWSDKFSSAIGYSMVDIDNSDLQTDDAFRRGHYALANLLYYPVTDVMAGIELQWGRRENNDDGFTSDDYRIQFSFKYNFSATIGGSSEVASKAAKTDGAEPRR